MSYVNRLREGVAIKTLVKDITARLYRSHAEDGIGTMIVGTLPNGCVLLYKQTFYAEDCDLEIQRKNGFVHLIEAETPELLSALTLLDRKFERFSVA